MTKPTTDEIYAQLTGILREVFDDEALVATPQLHAAAVDGWDSMGNVRLILAIEQEWGLRFRAGEIGGLANLGELVELIQRRL
ncbi:MAG: acyl carrier protein [Burkholderiales bacterium]|nr:acyl carrier protein [Burkholderiales bacterium]MDE1927065.1 acyl carrier protein [Burkholderiales bacterium]